MLRLRSREDGRSRFLFFERGGCDIGLALAVIYAGEEGKCFLTDFCVFPEYRGGGTDANAPGPSSPSPARTARVILS